MVLQLILFSIVLTNVIQYEKSIAQFQYIILQSMVYKALSCSINVPNVYCRALTKRSISCFGNC